MPSLLQHSMLTVSNYLPQGKLRVLTVMFADGLPAVDPLNVRSGIIRRISHVVRERWTHNPKNCMAYKDSSVYTKICCLVSTAATISEPEPSLNFSLLYWSLLIAQVVKDS